jgi:DNA-binding GntR family transcriptional regulator
MASEISKTRSMLVYERLRKDIFDGVLPPGTRLRSVELAERFSVSQAVLREALTRLAEQGLAVSVPQQGFRVRSVDLADLDELTEARIDVEGLVLRRAIARGDIRWESSLIAAHHTLTHTAAVTEAGKVNEAWVAAHEAFHRGMLEGCGNARLLAVVTSLRDAASLYRVWSRTVGHDDQRDIRLEHRQLLDAVLARDEPAAVRLLMQHIQRTTDALRESLARPAEEATVAG